MGSEVVELLPTEAAHAAIVISLDLKSRGSERERREFRDRSGGRSATITRSVLTLRQVMLAVPARRMFALEASCDSRKITSRLAKLAISSAVTR